jgi:hypothetical protein
MSASTLQVIFRHPEETDLVFPYLDKQRAVLKAQGQPMLPYQVLVGSDEIIIEFEMRVTDWDNPLGLKGLE